MARRPRLDVPGTCHHVMARGNDGQRIFRDAADRRSLLETIAAVKGRFPFRLYAYYLMSNHIHLLMEVGAAPLSYTMQRVLTSYVHAFNVRHKRIGHLFQGRFKSVACSRDSRLLELLRYIHLNPVRAGMVQDPADWPWSGHREYLGEDPRGLIDWGLPLGIFAPETAAAQECYRRFVLEGLAQVAAPKEPTPPPAPPPDNRLLRRAAFRQTPLLSLAERYCRDKRVGVAALRGPSRRRAVSAARRAFISHALGYGCRPSDIARFLNRSHTAILKAERMPLDGSFAASAAGP
ncbi:MAG: transposase [Elusimicrobiota bacterium]